MKLFRILMSLLMVCIGLVGTAQIVSAQIHSDDTDQSFHLFLPLITGGNATDTTGEGPADEDSTLADETFIEPEFTANDTAIRAAATTTILRPTSYRTTSGSDGGQPVANLHTQDQSGTQNDWNKYVECLTPGSNKYIGYRTYTLPANIDPATITALQLSANYLGSEKAYQTWTWTIYNWSTGKWVKIGDNSGATAWRWQAFTFNVGGTLRNYVRTSTREIRVRLQSNNTKDNMDLDYEALVVAAGSASTPVPTPTPTTPPSATPTRTPTNQPTAAPTPTATPTTPATGWWRPGPGTSWQIQLQGTVDTSFDVQLYVIDLFDTPLATIQQLHGQGRKVICYFSAGSYENWRDDANQFPAAVLGNPLDGWPGERWLDVRNINALGPIMAARMDVAVSKGCDGVDPDNVDGYTNGTGFPLTANHQLTYNRWLAQQAHARGLAIGLKNDLDQIPQLVSDFDWALNEQCFQYNECETLLPFVNAGKPVFGIEYNTNQDLFCPQANNWNFDFLKKNLDLMAWRYACR